MQRFFINKRGLIYIYFLDTDYAKRFCLFVFKERSFPFLSFPLMPIAFYRPSFLEE